MGVVIVNCLRRLPLEIVESYQNCFTNISTKIVTKKSENKLIPIIFKLIAFKISLGGKFPYFNGNFHLTV